jgi:hypothetical protein
MKTAQHHATVKTPEDAFFAFLKATINTKAISLKSRQISLADWARMPDAQRQRAAIFLEECEASEAAYAYECFLRNR